MTERVLIVDDDPLILNSLRRTLRRREVVATSDPRAALELLREEPGFAVIVADLLMPGIDGVKLLREALRISPDTTRIMLTGQAGLKDAVAAVNDGRVFRFLLKPCPAETLREAVEDGIRVSREVHEREVREREHYYLATHDALTGLPNRQLFEDRLEQGLASARRNGGQLAVLFLDLDGFKPINDTYGHDSGDALLQAVATRLRGCLREMDVVARIGGDEFAILGLGLHGVNDARIIADKVVRAVAHPFVFPEGQTCMVGTSVGISLYPDHAKEGAELISHADKAMYRAKQSGGARHFVYEASCDLSLRRG